MKVFGKSKIFGKSEIFSLDMSTMDQNDNFDQNLGSSEKYLGKVSAVDQNDNFVQNLGPKRQFFCKILDRAIVFGNSEIFSLNMSSKYEFEAKSWVG